MNVRYTLGEAQKCFGLDVIKHALLIITKCNILTTKKSKMALEKECKDLGLKYIYFNTSYEDKIVPKEEHD